MLPFDKVRYTLLPLVERHRGRTGLPFGQGADHDWVPDQDQYLVSVDRDDLIPLLTRDGDVFAACRSAVTAGAAVQVWGDGVPASGLARIYARRLRLIRQNGTPEMGFSEAVWALRAYGEGRVRIGAVTAADPPFHFQLFLNESASTLIACLGVDQRWKTRD